MITRLFRRSRISVAMLSITIIMVALIAYVPVSAKDTTSYTDNY